MEILGMAITQVFRGESFTRLTSHQYALKVADAIAYCNAHCIREWEEELVSNVSNQFGVEQGDLGFFMQVNLDELSQIGRAHV